MLWPGRRIPRIDHCIVVVQGGKAVGLGNHFGVAPEGDVDAVHWAQYCATDGVDSTITITQIPTVDQLNPYPTALITSLRPSGTSGPSCDWIPSLNNDEPGILCSDVNPTSVDCELPSEAATTCGSVDTGVEPLVHCIWQGE